MKKCKKVIKKKVQARRAKAGKTTRKTEGKIKKLPAMVLKKYRALLLKQRDKIGGGLSHIAQDALKTSQKDASGDLSGYSFHMADMASDNYEREFSLSRAGEEQDLLYAIDEALKRIADKTYGSCLQCSKPIAKRRLDAVPHTELCIKCQTKSEGK